MPRPVRSSLIQASTVAAPALPLEMQLLRIDPDWDNLRNDPRFQKLAESPAPK